jgi:transposase
MDLTKPQWEAVSPLLPKPAKRADGKGRPPQNIRAVLNGIFWVCRTGAPWSDMPKRYPPYQTCHRYFQSWVNAGVWDKVLWKIALDLRDRGKLDITECFIDGTFAPAKKGGLLLDALEKEKGQRSWRLQTLLVFLSPYGPDRPTEMKSSLFRRRWTQGS